MKEHEETIFKQVTTIKDFEATVAKLEEKMRAFETERRQLHNTIQELKVGEVSIDFHFE